MIKIYILYNLELHKYYVGRYWKDDMWTLDINNAFIFDTKKEILDLINIKNEKYKEDNMLYDILNTFDMYEIKTIITKLD